MSKESAAPLPLAGRCLCGAIRYELDAPVEVLVNCHCQFCRRAHGAAFATASPVPSQALRIVAGEEELSRHGGRFFCRICATRLYNRAPAGLIVLVVTSLDQEPAIAPSAHMNLESKAPWYEILDDAPRFDALPPGVSDALSKPD